MAKLIINSWNINNLELYHTMKKIYVLLTVLLLSVAITGCEYGDCYDCHEHECICSSDECPDCHECECICKK